MLHKIGNIIKGNFNFLLNFLFLILRMHHDLAAQASTERLILQDCRIGKAQGGEIKHGIAHTAVPFSLLFVGQHTFTAGIVAEIGLSDISGVQYQRLPALRADKFAVLAFCSHFQAQLLNVVSVPILQRRCFP